MIKKNILLTGASGTVGFEALKQLLALDRYTITVFDQESEASREKLLPFKDKITIVFGDISNFDDLNAIRNIDFAIHLAAVIPPVADDFPPLAKKVNLNGTQNLVKQLEKHSPTAFMMFSSSISVYGDRIVDPYINVGDQLQPSEGDYYATTKIAAEEYIRNSKLDYTIFRLAAIMGNHKISKLMFHQPLNTALEIATPRDTARAFVNGIEKQHLLSKRIFNLGGGESCRASYKVFLEEIVHFRQDSLDDYFKMESEKVSSGRKIATSIIKEPVKWFLLKKSEPYQAFKEHNSIQMKHYFN